MAEGKLDLPADLLSSKPFDRPWTSKVEASGGNEEKVDELKDQLASESSIPFSPQWLYAKPTETKMDACFQNSVSTGNSSDPNQEGWCLDGSEEKKDWRRILTESEISRRWREEERESSLLSGRRDRRKGERCLDTTSTRETTESRLLSSSDWCHDGNTRNPGHESRCDSKWSSRWGPEDKEKESCFEKRMDIEKEKENTKSDSQPFVSSNRSGSECDIDSHDKWRPRHRMELHSSGSTTSHPAPGFGPEKGRLENHNPGFTIGRGRSTGVGRSSCASPIGAIHSFKSEILPGKPNLFADTFRYPRSKLLDIYRRQKLDPSFAAMPDGMEESPPLTQVGIIEPLAFFAPDTEEEAILNDIWRGKVTNSVVYNSCRQGKSSENVSEVGDSESSEEKEGILSHIPTGATNDTLQEAASADAYRAPIEAGKRVSHEEEDKITSSSSNSDGIIPTVPKPNGLCSAIEIGSIHSNMSENWQMELSSSGHPQFGGNEPTPLFDNKLNLPGDSSSLFHVAFEQNQSSDGQLMESKSGTKSVGAATSPEEFTLFYIDPQGNTQGPFLAADIIIWFEQGFFGLDLPVCLGDSPKGTPFQELGDIMPQLKAKDGHAGIVNLNCKLEESGALGGNLEASTPASAPVSNIPDSSTENDLHHPLSEFNNFSSQHVHSRISEPEAPLQMPHSQGQNFEDFVAQDEEIVFPGRSGNSSYPVVKSSSHVNDPVANSGSQLSLPNELTEIDVPNLSGNKLHHFVLLWSEPEGAQSRNNQPSNVSFGIGRAAPFGSVADPAVSGEPWSDVYRKSVLPDHNLFQDALAAQHILHVEQESNHFDVAERLMSQQVLKQRFQQLNMLSPHRRLNESVLEHVPSQNQNFLQQRQLSNLSAPDVEHLLDLEMQQQPQLQLQQYQLQQQIQFHQQQKLLRERQQSQVQQLLLEQLLRGQVPDTGLGQSHCDPSRSNNVLDQVLLEQRLVHELQQQSHNHPRHVPSTEQLIQAKFGQAPLEEPQRDLFELILLAQHGQSQPLEHQLLQQEQLQRQLSMGLRQHNEEHDLDSIWRSDQTNQLLRNHTGINRLHSSGFSPLDFYQQQQRPIHEEQLRHLERNLSLKEQLHQGLFEPLSLHFERSMSLPAVASGVNRDVVNAMFCAKGLDTREPTTHMQSAGQAVTFSSGVHPHNPHHSLVPNQVHASQLDANDSYWSKSNGQLGQLGNDRIEPRIQKLHFNSERQKRHSEFKMTSENPGLWMFDGLNDDKSRQFLMELLHQKSGHQPEPLDRFASGIYTGSSSLDHPFSVLAGQDAGINKSFVVGSYSSSSSEPSHISFTDKLAGGSEFNERLPFRAESVAFSEGQPFLSPISENGHAIYGGANVTGLLTASKELSDVEWRKNGSKSNAVTVGSMFEGQDSMDKSGGFTSANQGEITINALSSHSSFSVSGGIAGFYNNHIGSCNSFSDDIARDCVQVPAKAQDNMLLRHIPISRASLSQEGLSDCDSDSPIRGKNSLSSNEGGKREPGGNLANHLDIAASAKKEMHFRSSSSRGDGDVSEASFIDMLRSNAQKNAVPEVHGTGGPESSDGIHGGRGGKRKGKKGRQIDPALLGFKITSNRIMMGEIHGIND